MKRAVILSCLLLAFAAGIPGVRAAAPVVRATLKPDTVLIGTDHYDFDPSPGLLLGRKIVDELLNVRCPCIDEHEFGALILQTDCAITLLYWRSQHCRNDPRRSGVGRVEEARLESLDQRPVMATAFHGGSNAGAFP